MIILGLHIVQFHMMLNTIPRIQEIYLVLYSVSEVTLEILFANIIQILILSRDLVKVGFLVH